MHKLIKEDSILRSFFNYLFVEKGLSSNTVNAYKNDIYSFVSWVEKSKFDYLKLKEEDKTVSYTHLTLPTKRIV